MKIKKYNLFLAILIVTNAATFTLSNYLTVNVNDKVIIPSSEYKVLKEVYEDNKKVALVRKQ
jgi:hypothetical protein